MSAENKFQILDLI